MKHLGDITQIKGNEAPAVDCIIGGSPCQDLSLAGKRAGLAGARSGLYMEQIRIIKEMRAHDRINGRTGVDVRPRYMVWENVPGAFSTNGGRDFAAVLEEAIRVAEPKAPSVSVPKKGWPTAGCYYDEMGNWSVAWRVMDSQYWGVPQRRRRICLVADFNGLNAPKIVFGEAEHHRSTKRNRGDSSVGDIGDESRSEVQPVTEGLSGHPESYEPKGQEAAGYVRESFGGASKAIGFPLGFRPENVRCYDETATTLCNGTRPGFTTGVIQPVTFEPGIASREGGHVYNGVSGTLRANAGDNQMSVVQPIVGQHILDDQGGSQISVRDDGKCPTLRAETHGNLPCVMETICLEGNGSRPSHKGDGYIESDTMYTLNTIERHGVAYGIGAYHSKAWKSDNPNSGVYEADTSKTLDSLNCGYPACNQGGMAAVQPVSCVASSASNAEITDGSISPCLCARAGTGGNLVTSPRHIVRRLTPLECERLQGFPDGWTLIGDPVEEEIADYVAVFDESKYIAPNPADFGLTDEDLNDYAPVDDEDSLDDEDAYDDNYLEYLDACAKARSKATKRVKVGSHMETNYYYTDSGGKRKKVSDSARYKALGNSIALPPWKWTLKRLCACYERDATLASLFDGIGGFPYIWEQINGKGSCLWASEIEEFPIAVTKLRFGGNDDESNA